MKRILLFIITGLICLYPVHQVFSQTIPDPQYIIVRKAPSATNTRNTWDYNWPNTITQSGIDEILEGFNYVVGEDSRKLAIEMIVWYNHTPGYASDITNVKQSIQKALDLAVANDLPIVLSLDGWIYMDRYPDLWYWWKPGITQAEKQRRINNVEWTCFNPADPPDPNNPDCVPLKISWRSWGGPQTRVNPHPNLASPDIIAHNQNMLRQLVPTIVTWYQNLPDNKKYLFGGVILEMEMAIGTNYTYWPNGNTYLNGNPANDPQPPDPNKPLFGIKQLGYAAVKTLGLATGGTITSSQLTQVVKNYLTQITQTAYDLGIPKNKIFTHVGGYFQSSSDLTRYPTNIAFVKPEAAIVPYANPGWSFYDTNNGGYPGDGDANPVFTSTLDQINNNIWAASEWLYIGDNSNNQFESALRNTLSYRNNKFVSVSNWEQISGCAEPNAQGNVVCSFSDTNPNNDHPWLIATRNVLSEGQNISPSPTPTPTPTPIPFFEPIVTFRYLTPSSVRIDWTSIPGADTYHFQASLYDHKFAGDEGYVCTLRTGSSPFVCQGSDDAVGIPTTNGWGNFTSVDLSNLHCNTPYYIHVKAGKTGTQIPGLWSDDLMVVTLPCPTPTNTPIPTPTNTSTPTSSPTSTSTPTPTNTPTNAPTHFPPPPTNTPIYTNTPTPTPPTATRVPSVTSTPNPTPRTTSSSTPMPTRVPTNTPIPQNTSIPTQTPSKVGDANGDRKVDEADYDIWYTHFGTTLAGKAQVGDFNGDGKVDGADYILWVINYGT